MRAEDVVRLPSMPLAGPSYPRGPYRFVDRQYMVITYESDAEAVRAQLPEPLQPLDRPLVHYEWIHMPDSSGFGSYTESGLVIPCRLHGEPVGFVSQMYLDDDPPIVAGREIWGFPKKYAHPKLEVTKDAAAATAMLSGTQVNLKIVPGVDGAPAICQLVAYNLADIRVKGFWTGPGRLHLVPHVNAPVADLPVRRVIGARHLIADLTLPYGRVVHDYLR